MNYQITLGIAEDELSKWLMKAKEKYGSFDDGRVDYTHAPIAPIVMCTVTYKDTILLVKRGYGLADAEGYWSIITGFIDETRPVREIACQELVEELGLHIAPLKIRVAQSYTLRNPKEKRSYIVFPCLIKLDSKPKITLNKEHTDFAWIKRNAVNTYYILDDLPYAIDSALKLL